MGYDSSKFNCITQSVAGKRGWQYYDTGGESVATFSGEGASAFFTDAGDKGAVTGDWCTIRDLNGAKVYQGYFSEVLDTGATQGAWKRDTG